MGKVVTLYLFYLYPPTPNILFVPTPTQYFICTNTHLKYYNFGLGGKQPNLFSAIYCALVKINLLNMDRL